MFETYNSRYKAEKRKNADMQFIYETVMEEDPEIDPEVDIDDTVDTESIPPEVMKKVENEIDRLISERDYDDSEIEELLDEDDLEDTLDEACTMIY